MKKIVKIFLILILAFVIADFSNKNIFLANSPVFDPFFTTRISESIKSRMNSIALIFNRISNTAGITLPNLDTNPLSRNSETNPTSPSNKQTQSAIQKVLTEAVLKQTSKGVYAGENQGYQITTYVIDEINWIPYTYTLSDGRKITYLIAEGTEPWPQEIVEAVYKNK